MLAPGWAWSRDWIGLPLRCMIVLRVGGCECLRWCQRAIALAALLLCFQIYHWSLWRQAGPACSLWFSYPLRCIFDAAVPGKIVPWVRTSHCIGGPFVVWPEMTWSFWRQTGPAHNFRVPLPLPCVTSLYRSLSANYR